MKTIIKWFFIILGVPFLILQFIRPDRNHSDQRPTAHISQAFPIPPDVQTILERSCLDCHSNNTDYPWYAEVQPVGWWLQSHIDDGKDELNFDEFASYRPMRQFTKLQQIAEEIEEEAMPLPSYVFMHSDSRLSTDQKEVLTEWVTAMRDSMKARYPADSLQRPRRRQE